MSSPGYNNVKGAIPEPYGQLEPVIQQEHNAPIPIAEYSAFPEVAYEQDVLPEVTPDSRHRSDSAKYPAFEQGGQNSQGYTLPPWEANSTKETRYCCGMTKIAFWVCVLVAVLVLACAIAGGVAGGLKSHHHSGATANTAPGTTPKPPLYGSNLAAINWTDEDSIERRAVFYQLNGALFVSQAQGQNTTWTHFNISAQFVQYQGDLALNPRNGTPLAAAATPWQAGRTAAWDGVTAFAVVLFYFSETNQARQLWTSIGDLSKWQEGGLFPELATTASPSDNSQLAASGYYCGKGCINVMCILFQGVDNSVQCTCSQGAGPPVGSPVIVFQTAPPSSPLILLPFAADNGHNITYDSELLALFLDGSNVGVLAFNHGDDNSWDTNTPYTSELPSLAQVNGTLPRIAGSSSDALGNVLLVAMTADGNFTASFWRGSAQDWTESLILTFSNHDGTSFSSRPEIDIPIIAMDNNHSLYGITADGESIIEYNWESSNPSLFTWTSSVNVTQALGE
ncbi:hypothetical protein V8E51_002480 [Hyaloscypha variabilis]